MSARDPVTGAKKWESQFPEPPLASLLATGGNLVFVPDARGSLRAYDAEQRGKELWSHNNGIGHNGGIISYTAKGKQYDTCRCQPCQERVSLWVEAELRLGGLERILDRPARALHPHQASRSAVPAGHQVEKNARS